MCIKDCLYCLMMPLKILVWIRSAAKLAVNKVHPVVEENFAVNYDQRTSFQPTEYNQDRASISSEDTYIDGLWNFPEYGNYTYGSSNNFTVPIWLLQQQARNVNGKLRTSASAVDASAVGDVWTSHYNYPTMDLGYYEQGHEPDSPKIEKGRKFSFYDNMYSYHEDYSPTEPHEIFNQFSRPSSLSSGSSSVSSGGGVPTRRYDSAPGYYADLDRDALHRLYLNHSYGSHNGEQENIANSSQNDHQNAELHCSNPSPISADAALEVKKRSNSLQVPNGIESSPNSDDIGLKIVSREILRIRGRSLSECSYTDRVVLEILDTERKYVRDLRDIVEGYIYHIGSLSPPLMSREEFEALFGNISDIYSFNRKFLQVIESCGGDAVRIARCFTLQREGFAIYSAYCTNYPRAVETLIRCIRNEKISAELKQIQKGLGHPLPLGSYLLKPVQRILKYHLLLQKILDHTDEASAGHADIAQAVEFMTGVARHIDTMKRRHESSVRTQEIKSLMLDWRGPDLTSLGNLILEDKFRVYGAKALRLIFLFNKALIIAKHRDDGALLVKSFIMCSNLMLMESIPKQPLNFQIVPFDSPKIQYTIQAKSADQKKKWCQEIKRLMLDNYNVTIPDAAKELVMRLGNSRHEERPKSSKDFLDPTRIQPAAPEYLERWRGRRKSAGTIQDLKLKAKKESSELNLSGNSQTLQNQQAWRRKSDGADFRNLVNELRKKSLSQTFAVATTLKVLQNNNDKEFIKQHKDNGDEESTIIEQEIPPNNNYTGRPATNDHTPNNQHNLSASVCRSPSPQFKDATTNTNSFRCNSSKQVSTQLNTTESDYLSNTNIANFTTDSPFPDPNVTLNPDTQHTIDLGDLTRKDSVAIRKAKLGGNGRTQKKQTVTFEKCDENMNKSSGNSAADFSIGNSNQIMNESQKNPYSNHFIDMSNLNEIQEPIPFVKIDFAISNTFDSKPAVSQVEGINEERNASPGSLTTGLTQHSVIRARRRSYECPINRVNISKNGDDSPSTPVILVSDSDADLRSRSAGNSPCLALNRLRIRQGFDVAVQNSSDNEHETFCQCAKYAPRTPTVDNMDLNLLENDSLVETEILEVETDCKCTSNIFNDHIYKCDSQSSCNDGISNYTCSSDANISETEEKELNESFSRLKSAVLNSNLFSTDELNDICKTLKCDDDLVDSTEVNSIHCPTVERIECISANRDQKINNLKQNANRSRLRLKILKHSPTEDARSKSTDRITNALKNTLNQVASKFSRRRILSCSTSTNHNNTSRATPKTAPAAVEVADISVQEKSTINSSVDQLYQNSNNDFNASVSQFAQNENDWGRNHSATLSTPTNPSEASFSNSSGVSVEILDLCEPGIPGQGDGSVQPAPATLEIGLLTPQPPPRRSRLGKDRRSENSSTSSDSAQLLGLSDANEIRGFTEMQGMENKREFEKRSKSIGDAFRQRNDEILKESPLSISQQCNIINSTHCLQWQNFRKCLENKKLQFGKVASEIDLKSCHIFDQHYKIPTTEKDSSRTLDRNIRGDIKMGVYQTKSGIETCCSSLSLNGALGSSYHNTPVMSVTPSRKGSQTGSPKLISFQQYDIDSCQTFVG